MHPNPAFHTQTALRNLDFARTRGFGTLSVAVEGQPLLSHVPFLISQDGGSADLHLVRSNPIARALKTPLPALIAVMGPDSYVSPDWYDTPDQVPTWNYVAVHLTGTLSLLPQDAMRDMLDRQTAAHETLLAPKPPWSVAKMTPEVRDRMMRQIVPCRLQIEAVDGTWKLNQNKPDALRQRAADHVEAAGLGTATGQLAALMRDA